MGVAVGKFKDLAKALGIADSDVSLGGELAIAYGARGRSGAAAHFEPERNVINLTKMNGAGALGHEWGHALDYYLARKSEAKTTFLSDGAYIKDSPMYELMRTIKYRNGGFSDFYSDAKKMDKLHTKTDKGYWASDVELFARAFHCYVKDKLQPERSDYLCGLAETSSIDEKGKPVRTYPTGEERKAINEQFDKLIGILKEKGLLHSIEKFKPKVLESFVAYENVQNEHEQLTFGDVFSVSDSKTADLNKSAVKNISPDEEKILQMAEKIQKNRKEDKAFAQALDSFLKSGKKTTSGIFVAATSNALAVAGANKDLDVVIMPDTILKCMSSPNQVYHGHDLSKETMKQLPDELRNPTLILKGSHESSLVAVTELKDKNNHEIIVSIELESKKGRQEVNRITSVYGKNNFTAYLERQINQQKNLIAYNKEKANEMFQSLGLQLPPEETFISFDNSITYSLDNVNYPQADLTKSIQSKETSEAFSVSDSQKANLSKSAVKEEKTQIRIRCFGEQDGVYRAHILHDGEKQWRIVRSEEGRLYVTTGSKRNNDLKKHYLNNEQSDRFRDFVMNGARTAENTAINKSIPALAKPGIKKL